MKPEEVTLSRKKKFKVALRLLRHEGLYIVHELCRLIFRPYVIIPPVIYVISASKITEWCENGGTCRINDDLMNQILFYGVANVVATAIVLGVLALLFILIRELWRMIEQTDMAVTIRKQYEALCHEEKIKELEQVDVTLLEDKDEV
jgi:hypothetical protein